MPDARCITTNNALRKNGSAICGAGCAKEATERYPELEQILGQLITVEGPGVHIVDEGGFDAPTPGGFEPPLIAFPVKHHWRQKADLELIVASAHHLAAITEANGWQEVWLPRPGCGFGGLDWDIQVGPALEPIFDDRIVIIDFPDASDAPAPAPAAERPIPDIL